MGTNALIVFGIKLEYRNPVIFTALTIALVIVLALRPKFHLTSVPSLTFWVPFLTHAYVLVAGLIAGHILNPSFLLVVGIIMIAISFYLHRPTLQHILNW